MTIMTIQAKKYVASLTLLGLALACIVAYTPASAGQIPTAGISALRLTVDKPIIHLGESVRLSGSHFTPGAWVAISLHGPLSAAGLGHIYTRARVAPDGAFSVRISISRYPDAASRQWHTVVIAATSSAMLEGVREGAAVAVQADPMPGIDIVDRARVVRTSLVIDGTSVPALVTAAGPARYRVSYAGHLRAGIYSAYLKWLDAAGERGHSFWRFRIGSPYAVAAAPSLNLSAYRIRLGDQLGVAGNGFTPDATVTIRLGGPDEPPGAPVGVALVDAAGQFHTLIRIARYPSANAGTSRTVYVAVTARGAMVGDLPEGATVAVHVTG